MTSREKSILRRRVVLALAGLAGLVAAAVLVIVAAWVRADRQRVPEAMMRPPADVVAWPAEKKDGDNGRSPAPRTKETGRPRLNAQSYEEFLSERLTDNPKEAGARAYLAVIDKLRAQPLSAEDERLFLKPVAWRDGKVNCYTTVCPGEAVSPEQAAWLRAHGELLECMLRFCESGHLPGRSRQELLSGSAVLPFPNIEFLERCIRLLQAEATRRAGAGDDAGAQRIHLALLRMAAKLNDRGLPTYRYQAVLFFCRAAEGMGLWLKTARLDPAAVARLRRDLGELHADFFAPGRLREYLEICYTADRRQQIEVLNAGWMVMAGRAIKVGEIDMYKRFLGVPLFRVDRVARLALGGMHYKYEIPRLLGEYDDFWKKMMERSQMAWPDFMAAGELPYPADNPLFMFGGEPIDKNGGGPRALEGLNAPERVAEARLNLCRALLECRAAQPATGGTQAGRGNGLQGPAVKAEADLRKDRENPWRDPFTERALKVKEEPSGTSATTLIYSLGPDMKDQGGTGTERNVDLRADGRDAGDDLVLRIDRAISK